MHVYVVLFRSLCDGSSIELGRSMVVIRELCTRTLILCVYPSGKCTMASVLLTYLFRVPSIITYLIFRRGPNNSIKPDDSDITYGETWEHCGISNPKGWVILSA